MWAFWPKTHFFFLFNAIKKNTKIYKIGEKKWAFGHEDFLQEILQFSWPKIVRTKNMDSYEEEEEIAHLLHFLFLFDLESDWRNFMDLENKFQAKLITELKKMFPGCMVLKNDPDYIQGIPDLLILYNDKWAVLECKKCANAKRQSNQEYYVGQMDKMSFARFICPENKEEVLHELQQAFES